MSEEDFAGGTQGFEDFDDGRRFLSDARKDDWTQEEERMFYETYLSADGNMKKVCDAMERAPYARDRKLVQRFRFNATRAVAGVPAEFEFELGYEGARGRFWRRFDRIGSFARRRGWRVRVCGPLDSDWG